jgi:hypothetical protein
VGNGIRHPPYKDGGDWFTVEIEYPCYAAHAPNPSKYIGDSYVSWKCPRSSLMTASWSSSVIS